MTWPRRIRFVDVDIATDQYRWTDGSFWSEAPGIGQAWVIPDGQRRPVLVQRHTDRFRRIDACRDIPWPDVDRLVTRGR